MLRGQGLGVAPVRLVPEAPLTGLPAILSPEGRGFHLLRRPLFTHPVVGREGWGLFRFAASVA